MAKAKKNPVGRPVRTDKDNTKATSAERHTRPGEMRKTYIMRIDQVKRIEAIAEEDSKPQKDVLADAIDLYCNQRDKKKR